MIDREKLRNFDRKFAEWVKIVAETKPLADEITELCDELMGDVETETEKLFAMMYIEQGRNMITELMDIITEAARYAKRIYRDTEGKE